MSSNNSSSNGKVTNLKITANLSSPVVLDFGSPIESILMFAAYLDAFGSEFYQLPDPKVEYVALPDNYEFPIELEGFGGNPEHWYYKASFAKYEVLTENLDYWSKRNRISAYATYGDPDGKARIDNTAGRLKDYRQPIYTKQIKQVAWYIQTNDAKHVRYLLDSYIMAIGKKTVQGHGKLSQNNGWQFEELENDYSTWQPNSDGELRLVKALPLQWLMGSKELQQLGGYNMMLTGYRPPYWLASNQAPCVVPDWI